MAPTPDGAQLERVESYQYPSGHVGHLTQNQLDTLQKFKDLCQSKKYYTPATGSTPASHDDETLLRYLRARKFLPQEAFNQLKDTEDWRKENQLETLYDTIDIDEYDATRRLYPQWLGRRDKRGIPVYLFEVSQIDNKAVVANAATKKGQTTLPASKEPPKMMRLFALYENMCRFVLPLCSTVSDRAYPETPISQSNNIVDISNVGLRQFWNLKAHMQDASLLATAHYPETLDRIFLIGAPSFFPTVWGWVKRWFDPITVSKIFILSAAEVKPTLLQYMDEENIPIKYGGKLDFKFGDMPMLEPAIADSLEWHDETRKGGFRSFPTGPIKWQRGADGKMQAVAVGSKNGTKRNLPIAEIRPAANTAQSSLTPGSAQRGGLMRTTTGVSTHPPSPPAGSEQANPYADEDDVSNNTSAGRVDDSVIPNATRNTGEGNTYLNYSNLTTTEGNTSTLPIRDNTTTQPSQPSQPHNPAFQDPAGERTQSPEVRTGTSENRFEQQGSTHAAERLSEGTPDVRHLGHGDKVQIMEPSTIGQTPKEHPIPTPEEPAPSVLDQAKSAAGTAASTAASYLPQSVLSAVGMGGEQKQEPASEVKKEDPAVDSMDERKVEEFLRAKSMSKPQQPGSQG